MATNRRAEKTINGLSLANKEGGTELVNEEYKYGMSVTNMGELSVANNTELTEKRKDGLSMSTTSENSTAMADLTAEKTRNGLSLATGEEKESLAVTKSTETERAP